jgi:hypothetical protein
MPLLRIGSRRHHLIDNLGEAFIVEHGISRLPSLVKTILSQVVLIDVGT